MAVAIDPKAGAKAARAIIAAHEAGMHDRKASDACRLCKKEQEASIMAKSPTTCAACGGTYDGTPSGMVKHDKTAKHLAGLATLEADATVAQATIAEVAAATKDEINADLVAADTSLAGALSQLIDSKEQDLARRQVDHKWRVANRPDQADAYEADKVTPLKVEIQLLRDVRKAL
jgi:hypothetical protein